MKSGSSCVCGVRVPTLSSAGNLVFESTRERFCADGMYADEPLGVFIVRGENIALVGELVRMYVPVCVICMRVDCVCVGGEEGHVRVRVSVCLQVYKNTHPCMYVRVVNRCVRVRGGSSSVRRPPCWAGSPHLGACIPPTGLPGGAWL